jgi:hypothetical protein
MDCVRK